MRLRYLGTATVLIEYAGQRILTDPAFDPAGTAYDFGPWYAPRAWFSSEKQYETPLAPTALGDLDAFLISHDHHADNLDLAGRDLVFAQRGARVYTTVAGAARLGVAPPAARPGRPGDGLGLGARVTGVAWGQRVALGSAWVTATPARHGPRGTPQVHEVNGWLLEPSAGSAEPVVWISGDTVLFDRLRDTLAGLVNRVDVAIVHCGAVRFPRVPVLGRSLFTFDGGQAAEACRLLAPRAIVPIHRSGWAHFREPEAALRATLDDAGLKAQAELLDLGAERSFVAS
jgi:L-ascorbate metabolism protein UlaG (beta-lactamase superfamily)